MVEDYVCGKKILFRLIIRQVGENYPKWQHFKQIMPILVGLCLQKTAL